MSDEGAVPNLGPDELAYVWRQYEYRHDLCWRAVYKVTFAVVTLAIVPYPRPDLTRELGWCALVAPCIASVLAILGYFFARNELELFAKAKLAHYEMQDRFWRSHITNPAVLARVERRLQPEKAGATAFDYFVKIYMIALVILSVINALFMWLRWLPRVLGA